MAAGSHAGMHALSGDYPIPNTGRACDDVANWGSPVEKQAMIGTIRILIGRQGGIVKVNGEKHPFPDYSLLITSDSACPNTYGLAYHDFHESDIQEIYTELVDLITNDPSHAFAPEALRIVSLDDDMMRVMELLARGSRPMLLRFIYVYCLGTDYAYFAALLRLLMTGDRSFIAFIESNKLMPWPVARFAEEFGLPLRKFNMLFQEKFGVPAKRWLLEHRLQHARSLLLCTQMRVLDIALESGFINHAHFTDTFRKRFLINPTETRLHAVDH